MGIKDEMWAVENGSIVKREQVERRFPGGNSAKVRDAIAFNVGELYAKHIVELHNSCVIQQLVRQVRNKLITEKEFVDRTGYTLDMDEITSIS
jgi:hypothetical protein